jgi:hypothetical protein
MCSHQFAFVWSAFHDSPPEGEYSREHIARPLRRVRKTKRSEWFFGKSARESLACRGNFDGHVRMLHPYLRVDGAYSLES